MKLRKVLLIIHFLGVLSCSKVEDNGCNSDETIGKEIFVKVNMPDDVFTKVQYSDDKVGKTENSLSWESGDKIAIAGLSGATYQKKELTLKTGDGTKNATFNGDGITGVNNYFIYYPSSVDIDSKKGTGSLNFDGQTQSGNNNATHLKNYILLSSDKGVSLTGGNTFNLNVKSSILKFNLKNIPEDIGRLDMLIWKVETANQTKNMALKFDSNKPITISKTSNNLTAYIGFMPNEMSIKPGGKFTVELVGSTKTYKAEKTSTSGKTYAAGARYTADLSSYEAVGNYRLGYETLPETEKKMYELMVKSVLDFASHSKTATRNYAYVNFEEIDLPDKNKNNGTNAALFNKLVTIIRADMPNLYHIMLAYRPPYSTKDNKPYYALNILSSIDEATYKSQIQQINSITDEMCKDITPDMSDFEKFKHIHDKFLPVTYSNTTNANSIIGGFIEEKVVCEGFARSILYLCQKIGIKAIYVEGQVDRNGNGTKIHHAWNYICIDGKWYLLDATDDNGLAGSQKANYRKFLLGKKAVLGEYPLTCNEYTLPTLEDENCPGSDALRNKK